jgi:hypothetical protein
MTETCYPVFQEGQTLTRDDLNVLRTFFDDRDRLLGRTIGFGMNCGLDGSIQADGLHIAPGLAIDQNGDALHLELEQRIPLPPTPVGAFPFVAPADGGFTAVLTSAETVIAAPECDEEGCEGHASLTCRTAAIVLVAGRVTGARFDFSSEPLLAQQPLRIRPSSTIEGPFVSLKTAILARIGSVLSTEARDKLSALVVETSDLKSVKAYKAAFVNQVLFAALDYLRCTRLLAVTCLRTATQPGVALGWLHQVGGAWQWDCSYRHAWEPPAGLSLSLVGGRCGDACRLHLDRLEGLILTFEVPEAPPATEPPKPGGIDPGDYHICWHHGATKWSKLIQFEECKIRVFPPEKIEKWPPDWWDDRRRRVEEVINPSEPWTIYEKDQPDFFDGPVIDLSPSFGGRAVGSGGNPGVKDALETLILTTGVDEPDVRVVTADEALTIPGYTPAGAVSPSDTVVLVVDELGKVDATGHVPAGRAVRNAGTAVPRAVERSTTALAEATAARNELVTVNSSLGVANEALEGLTQFQTEIKGWQQTTQGTLSNLLNLTADTGPIGKVGERMLALEARVDLAEKSVTRAGERIDQVLSGRAGGLTPEGIGRNAVINEELLTFFDTMRTSVARSAEGTPQEEAVRNALASGEESFRRIESGVRSGSLVLSHEADALTKTIDTMVEAVASAGAPAGALRDLRASARTLKDVITR